MDVKEFYQNALLQKGLLPDSSQARAIEMLQTLYLQWVAYKQQRNNKIRRLISRAEVPRGLYMWGGVGRGKSLLMDGFYNVVPVVRKTRVHFHEFMREMHRQLDERKAMSDPLEDIAQSVAKRYRLICFDEFHVSDIADAMILYNLLRALFDHGVSFVITSNYHPDNLYPDGLHRDRIIPAINLLKDRLDIINVDGGTDYRKKRLEQASAYYTPLNAATNKHLRDTFENLAETEEEDTRLKIESREIKALRRAGSIIWFDFATLCGGPRSQNDYLELASRFHTVILSDVPAMSASMSSAARRFTWLIDIFYDHKIKLIMSAEVAPDALYTEGALAHEFHRTVSRIIEMQSKQYMESTRQIY